MSYSSMPSRAEIIQLVAMFDSGRYAELENRARFRTSQYPNFGFGWKLLGGALQMQGKNALPAFRKAAELMPDEADAHYNLGVALKGMGLLDDAAASYRHALKLKPDYAEAHGNLGNVLKDLGRLDEAVASYRRALAIKPDSAETLNSLGTALKGLGQLDEALAGYRRAVALKPDFADAHYNLGNALKELGQLDDAGGSYRRAIVCKPDFVLAHNNLGAVLQELKQLDAALVSYRRALELKDDYAEAHCSLGNVLRELGQIEGARAAFRRALEIDPEFYGAMYGWANLLMECGEMTEAEALFGKALQIKPGDPDALCMLVKIKKVRADDENLAALLAMEIAARNGTLPITGKQAISLQFTLGECFDGLGDYDRAFQHFLEGCRLKRATFEYDAGKTTQDFAGLMQVFSRTAIDGLRGGGDPSRLPVFVLGMPRSGTTLTEQIIASHPDVHGGGELPDLLAIAHREVAGTRATYPENILALDREQLALWGRDYVARLQKIAPDARRITDKMPANFFALGLIHVMLPNAKIIHVNRNPVDTCLSCFTNEFYEKQFHTYDLAELGRYYVDYMRLMEHWRSVLPAGAFLDVQYEEIVADQETQARRIMDFCGLEWSDACKHFYENKRLIRTASVTQVRRPIYMSSVERWRPYEKYLGPLLDALGDLAVLRPETISLAGDAAVRHGLPSLRFHQVHAAPDA